MRKYPVERYLAGPELPIRDALRQIEESERRTLFVVDGERRLFGAITDGDIRRWLIGRGDIGAPIGDVCNRHPISVGADFDRANLATRLVELGATCVPQVDAQNRVVGVVFWEDVVLESEVESQGRQIDVPVVIMAGGRGTRMQPFTQVLPKPLLPIGDKTILELIIDRFVKHGIRRFWLTINYKANLLRAYFQDLPRSYEVAFVEEEMPLGTAGSLALIQEQLPGPFILTNCDNIIEADFADLMAQHAQQRNDVTMVVSLKKYKIPYGVCEIESGGQLKGIREKPEFDHLVNTGMYVLSPAVLAHIPAGRVFHMTDLIVAVQSAGGRVGVYPIGEGAWLDTGEWAEYKRTLQLFESRLSQ